MKALPALFALPCAVALVACAAAREGVRWEDAAPEVSVPATPVASAAAPEPVVTAVVTHDSSAPAVRVEGKDVGSTGLVDVRALELACLADAKALTDTRGVRARFDDVAGKQLVPVGELAFVLLERDPARSMTDPPPLLCRTIASSTVLRAPLIRAREPATRWLVRRIGAGLVVDAAALVAHSTDRKLGLTARPRVLLDEAGALVAVAVPVGVAEGAGGGD